MANVAELHQEYFLHVIRATKKIKAEVLLVLGGVNAKNAEP